MNERLMTRPSHIRLISKGTVRALREDSPAIVSLRDRSTPTGADPLADDWQIQFLAPGNASNCPLTSERS